MNEDIKTKIEEGLRKTKALIPYAPTDFIKNELQLSIDDLMSTLSYVESGQLMTEDMLLVLNASLAIIDELYNKKVCN